MLAALALLALVQDPQEKEVAALHARVAAQPAQVRAFIERRAGCNHFLGEEPYDRARRREIERALADLRCARIEADERRLRRRHAGHAETLALLDATADSLGW